jgi:predicted N-acetyltransferase YhbS
MVANIRPALPHEADILTELVLHSKAYWGYDEKFLQAAVKELTISRDFLQEHQSFVLERDGEIVGLSSLVQQEKGLILENLFISPQAIRQGNGQMLWDHAVEFARDHGYTTISLVSDPFAVDFYKKQGARITGRVESNIKPGRYLPQMCYELE